MCSSSVSDEYNKSTIFVNLLKLHQAEVFFFIEN